MGHKASSVKTVMGSKKEWLLPYGALWKDATRKCRWIEVEMEEGDYVLGSRWEGGVDISRRSVLRDAKVSASLSTGPRMGCPSMRPSSYTSEWTQRETHYRET